MTTTRVLAALVLCSPAVAQWSTDALSTGRARLTAVSVGGEALFAGGFVGPGIYTSRVDIYDAATDTWSIAELSAPRGELASASAAGRAFFGGGRADVSLSDRVDVYDAATGGWTTDSLSLARKGLVAAGADGLVFFAGGQFGPWPGTVTDVVDVHDTATGTWSTTNLSRGRTELTATAVGSRVLFAGGREPGGFASDRVDIYDVSTGSWSTAQLSVGRRLLVATSVGDLALFAGGATGFSTSSVRAEVDIYDASTGTWSTAALSVPRLNLTAVTVGHLALFAGGLAAGALDTVDIFDSTTGAWSTATLSVRRSSLASAAAGGTALFGGGLGQAGYATPHVDLFSPELGTLYCSPAIPNSTGSPAVIAAYGSAAVAAGDLQLVASQLPPGQFGYFLAGRTQGSINPPGSQGFICLQGNIGRFSAPPEILQGPIGSLQVDLTSIPVNPPTAVVPGDTWNFQCWYRDAHPGPTSNMTNGIAVTFETSGDPAVQFPVTLASQVEETVQLSVAITLSQAAGHDVAVPFTTGGTATYDSDWRVEEPNPILIPAGETVYEMTLVVAEDAAPEGDETAVVTLGAPTGGVLGTAPRFTLTIVDDD